LLLFSFMLALDITVTRMNTSISELVTGSWPSFAAQISIAS
jgi:hypothetical protein